VYSQLLLLFLFLLAGCTHYQKKTFENQDSIFQQEKKQLTLGQYRRSLLLDSETQGTEQLFLENQDSFKLSRLDSEIKKKVKFDLVEEVLDLGRKVKGEEREHCARLLFFLLTSLEQKEIKGEYFQLLKELSLRSFNKNDTREIFEKIFSFLKKERSKDKDFIYFLQKRFSQKRVSFPSQIRKIGFIIDQKENPGWMKKLIHSWENVQPFYQYYCVFAKELKQAYQIFVEKDIDVILTYGFSQDDFSTLSSLHQCPIISLQEPFESSFKNHFFFPPKSFFDKQSLNDLVQGETDIIVFCDQDLMEKEVIPLGKKRVVSNQSYRESIDGLLGIPSQRSFFEKHFSSSIDYLPLPCINKSVIILHTSPSLARLIYPYWKLKSSKENDFLGLSSLKILNLTLDQSLSGIYLPRLTEDYDEKTLVTLIESLPEFFHYPFTMKKTDSIFLFPKEQLIVQKDSYERYGVSKKL
jgi:hypothetical protein